MQLQAAIELISKAVGLVEPITNGKKDYEFDGFDLAAGDDQTLNDIYKEVTEKLKDIALLVEYANKPVKIDGKVYKNDLGRYQFDNSSIYLTSGELVELYVPEEQQYVKTTITHSEDDYYAVWYPQVELEGARVRVR